MVYAGIRNLLVEGACCGWRATFSEVAIRFGDLFVRQVELSMLPGEKCT